MMAYHFVGATLRDGRPVPADGEWLVHEGPVSICVSGLHASVDPFDALRYAPGAVLCRVEVEGVVATDLDKLVARRRRILARVNATAMLQRFARECAMEAAAAAGDEGWVTCYDYVAAGGVVDAVLAAAEAARAWAETARAAAGAAGAAGAAARWATLSAAVVAVGAAAKAASGDVALEAAAESARAATELRQRERFRALVREVLP